MQWNVTLNLSDKKSTYYVIKGLFDGVDGVVCGSAFVCCNQNTITLKCVLFATEMLKYYASVLDICKWQRGHHLVSIHKLLKTWSLLVCWLKFLVIFLSPSSQVPGENLHNHFLSHPTSYYHLPISYRLNSFVTWKNYIVPTAHTEYVICYHIMSVQVLILIYFSWWLQKFWYLTWLTFWYTLMPLPLS